MKIDATEFWKRYDNELLSQGKTLRDMCKYADVSYNTISTHRTRMTIPKVDVLLGMASFVGLSVEKLCASTEISNPMLKRIDRIRRACLIAKDEDLQLVERILRIDDSSRATFDFSPNPYKLNK